jgi:hypothetical protein
MSSLQNIFRNKTHGSVILMQVSIDNIPHNIILPLHWVVARGISPGGGVLQFRTKVNSV